MKIRLLSRLRRRYRIAYSKIEKVKDSHTGEDISSSKYVIFDDNLNTDLYYSSVDSAKIGRRILILRDIMKMRHEKRATKTFLNI